MAKKVTKKAKTTKKVRVQKSAKLEVSQEVANATIANSEIAPPATVVVTDETVASAIGENMDKIPVDKEQTGDTVGEVPSDTVDIENEVVQAETQVMVKNVNVSDEFNELLAELQNLKTENPAALIFLKKAVIASRKG